MFIKKIGKRIASLVLIFILYAIAWVTLLDPEWHDWRLLDRVRDNNQILYEYKLANGHYPDTLKSVGAQEKFCVLFKCFDIKYKVSGDKESYKTVAKANYPFVVFFDSLCPDLPNEGGNKNICARIGVQDYTRPDLPTYLKDKTLFPNPSEWPSL